MSLPGRFLGATLVALTIVSLVVRWLIGQVSPESVRAFESAADPFTSPIATVAVFLLLLALVGVAAAYMTVGPDHNGNRWRGR